MITNPNLGKIPHMWASNRSVGSAISPPDHPEQSWNARLQPVTSIPANRPLQSMDLSNDIRFEKPTYSPPTQVSKGLTTSQAGGSFTLYDITGGTKIFDYNPTTGVVTINGSLITQNSSTGTYTNIVLAGTNVVTGTMINGIYGTALYKAGSLVNALVGTSMFTGGTANPSAYQINGTVGVTGTAVYVKTVNFVGSTTTLGTILVSNGLVVSVN